MNDLNLMQGKVYRLSAAHRLIYILYIKQHDPMSNVHPNGTDQLTLWSSRAMFSPVFLQ